MVLLHHFPVCFEVHLKMLGFSEGVAVGHCGGKENIFCFSTFEEVLSFVSQNAKYFI